MPSAQDSQKFFSKNKLYLWDHDPDGVGAVVVSPDAGTTKRMVDMRDFNRFSVAVKNTVLTGAGITLLEIVASDDALGATNLTQIKTSGTIAPNDLNDWARLECGADEVRQIAAAAGTTLRYVGARLTVANAADEAAAIYILSEPRFAFKDMTPATTIT
jgi:hypothetical protein